MIVVQFCTILKVTEFYTLNNELYVHRLYPNKTVKNEIIHIKKRN